MSTSQAQAGSQVYDDAQEGQRILTQREMSDDSETEDDYAHEVKSSHYPVPDEKEAYQIALKERESAREVIENKNKAWL